MLKGHVFSKQIFGNPIFALFINTFLNGKNGVSNNYKNGMKVTYSGSTVTVSSGAVCIQGRFLEEDTSSSIAAGTSSSYCKLVIEINLDATNTESEFNQASYKVVKSSSGYPSLTQTNIVKNNAGIYQYELARFRTSSSGITNFQDMRTFLDFDSIYAAIQTEYQSVLQQLQTEFANVKDGSAYFLKATQLRDEDLNDYHTEGFYFAYGGNNAKNKPSGVNNFGLFVTRLGQNVYKQILHFNNNIYTRICDNGSWTSWIQIITQDKFAVLTGSHTLDKSLDYGNDFTQTTWHVAYPSGFNKDNCVLISFGGSFTDVYSFGDQNAASAASSNYTGAVPRGITLNADDIVVQAWNWSGEKTLKYKIVLMKV